LYLKEYINDARYHERQNHGQTVIEVSNVGGNFKVAIPCRINPIKYLKCLYLRAES